ncbi:MAG: hypothetical protein EOO08_11260 [Chitinophagaceae bacterium]|nr:MAG: hypothetical protein EOO08_11260 [Chitinophagaceae bacterium]
MRKLYFLLCLMLTSVVGFGQLINEPFDYPASVTNGITAQSSSTWLVLNSGSDSIMVTSGSLSYPGLAASTGNKVSFDGQGVDAYRQLATNQTATTYVSFLLNVSSLGGLSTTGGYFFGLTPGTTSGTIGTSVWTRKATTGYNIGVNSRTTTANTLWLPTELAVNTTYLVVVAYNFAAAAGDDFATIWLNPTSLGGAAPTPDGTAVVSAGDLANIGRVQLRQPGAASEAPFLNIDELRVGLDWASVTPSSAGTPTLSTTTLTSFGNTCINTTAGPNSFTLTGSSLTAADVVVGPLDGYTFSTTSGGTYSSTLTITQGGGALSQEVFVRFTPTAAQSYNGSIPVTGGGATATSVSASGTGIGASLATVGTAAPAGTTFNGTTLNGTLTATGCSNVTSYGFIYSTTSGFDPATTGTTVTATNLAGTTFSNAVSGLNPSTTYYYVSFATNGTGTAYSTQAQFTTQALPTPSVPVATAATNVTGNGFTANWDAATGTVTGYFLDVYTQGPGTVLGGRLAGWNVPTADDAGRIANTGNANNINAATLFAVNGGTVTYSYPGAPASSGSTFTVSTTGWDAGIDTKYWQVDVNTSGASNITVSSLQASSNTGPRDWKIQYRLGNAGTWNDVTGGTVTVATSTATSPVQYYGPSNLALPADAANQPLVQIRWVVTSTTSVNGATVATTGTSRITSIYVKGDYPGTVNTYVLQNQAVGNVTSYNVTGLSPNTTYYYVVRADNGGSTSANSNEISVVTTAAATPALSAGALSAFANTCINTTAGPNNFTVTGSNLTGNVTVGALAGYTYSTTSGGTYTSTLTLTPTAGALNETVFVKFIPTAVQSYNGNINISGGGATAVDVAASGAGINTATVVTTGASSGVTTSAATLAGTIADGCSATTAYGVVYSTTSGFNPASSGTTATGGNLTGGTFSVSLSGLNANTTYYYVAYATNGGGTTYGTQQSFTTGSLPATLSAGTLTAFGNKCINTSSTGSFTVTGTNLTGDVTVGALAGYAYSSVSGGPYTSTLTLTPTAGALNSTVFVQFAPTAAQAYNGNITLTGGGASAVNVAASGTGINTAPGINTDAPSAVTSTTATTQGEIFSTGCSAITAYGVVYSTTSGFDPASAGTNVQGTNLSGGIFTVGLSGLAPSTTYYVVAYATNGGGTTYGTQQTFTTSAGATIPAAPVATAATSVTSTGFTANWNAVTGATGYFLDVYTLGGGTQTIAGWDMAVNTSVAAASTANQGNAANINIQQLTTNSGGALSTPAGFSGTSGTPNPYSVSSNGWNLGNGTKYWQVDVNTTGATGLTVTSNQGSSGTGPKDWKLQYRVGNTGAFTDVAGGTVTLTTAVVPATANTWGTLTNVALPTATENQPLVQLRWIMTSDLAINGAAVASTGTSRISGIYVKAAGGAPTPVYVTGYQNLPTGNVTSWNVTGLTPNTTYYYVVRATNAAGTSPNSNEISVTTQAGAGLTASALTAFGNTCINTTSAANSFTITGTNLAAGNVFVGPLTGYLFSTTVGGTYDPQLTIPTTGGAFSQQVFVQFTPTAVQSYSGNIPVAGGGATAINVAASGAGVNTATSVATAAATGVSASGATIPGTITAGCAATTAYGAIYSTTSGFDPATTGTNVAGTNLAAGAFSVPLSGLAAATTYYYVTYATSANGTVYSAQQSFTTSAAGSAPAAPIATAATSVTTTGFTANWNAVTGATGYFLDVYTLGAGSGTQTVAGWDMPVNTVAAQTANQGNAANINIQQLTTNTGGTISYPAGYSGTSGTPNPYSVSSNGWNTGAGNKYWQVDVNTTSATGLTLSSNQGGSNTGPRDFKIQYRVGAGGTWTDVPGGTVIIPAAAVSPGTPATWGVVTDLALPSDAENKPLVSIRWLMTSETSVNGATVANTGTSRISGIYVKAAGGSPTPVYVTGYQNLPTGNVTSWNVTGLTPNTTYYYVVRATNAAGTSPNSNEISVTTQIAPVLSAGTLTAFGSVCPNTTSAANSFTITGSALQAGNVTVGPLAGFAFSTTSGGTYTSSLSIPTTGGAFSQQVFVQFTPTAVQSYSGNIPVAGGGATAINVAASGAGANNAPTVTAGTATSVTNITATVPGTISNNGCTAVTAYGVEWSTTSGFANGTGTQAPASNLAGGSFSSNLTGLTASTTYYYHTYATNAGGTSYSAQGSFTTAAGPVISLTVSPLANFDSVCVNTVSVPRSFTITGTNLTTANITVAAQPGFQYATTATGPYSPSLSLTQPGGSYSQTVFVQFLPTAVQSYNSGIQVSGGGASSTIIVSTTAFGKVQAPTVVTLDSTNITFNSVAIRGAVLANGCSALTEVGVEWSTLPNFQLGTGQTMAASGVPTGASYLVTLSNLVPGTTYYYRAYARNAGATGYGALKSVTLSGLSAGLQLWPNPVMAGHSMQLTLKGLTSGYHGILLYNSAGAQVYRRNLFIQGDYIIERISFPATLAAGTYLLRVVNNDGTIASRTIVIGN